MSGLSAFAKVLNPNLRGYRVAASKPDWFPQAYIRRYHGSGVAARNVLQILQRDDWEDPLNPVEKLWGAVVPFPVCRWLGERRMVRH